MKINIDEIKKDPLKKERLAYNGRTGNRIDVEIYLRPLRAIYKVGKEVGESANLFDNLDDAIKKFNSLEEQDKRTCDTCGVTQDYIVMNARNIINGFAEKSKWGLI